MKNTLVEIQKCKTCQMELLPYRDFNGDPHLEKDFCDSKCQVVWEKYGKFLIEDRWKAEIAARRAEQSTQETSQTIDLTL